MASQPRPRHRKQRPRPRPCHSDANVPAGNPQIHAALTQARTFWRNPEKFALLSIYEQRISRKIQRNEERLHALQSARKAALEQASKKPALLADLPESKGKSYDPAPDFASSRGFAFSPAGFCRALDRHRSLTEAKIPAATPKRPNRDSSHRKAAAANVEVRRSQKLQDSVTVR